MLGGALQGKPLDLERVACNARCQITGLNLEDVEALMPRQSHQFPDADKVAYHVMPIASREKNTG